MTTDPHDCPRCGRPVKGLPTNKTKLCQRCASRLAGKARALRGIGMCSHANIVRQARNGARQSAIARRS